MNNTCSACQKNITASRSIKCTKCIAIFHLICVNISAGDKQKNNENWVCPMCRVREPKGDNTNTPIRALTTTGAGASDVTDTDPPENLSRAPKRLAIGSTATSPQTQMMHSSKQEYAASTELVNEIKLMRQDMRSFREDFNALRDGLSAVRSAIEGFGGRMDGMETRLIGLEMKYEELQAGPDVSDLLVTIEQLKSELNDRDQESFLNDIEIGGIPEEHGENTTHLVSIVAEKLGVSCDARDVVLVERPGGARIRRAPSGESAVVSRPRPILVRLARRQLRDAFLQAARVRRGITTDGMGLAATPTNFFVNERLSRRNRVLFFKTREEARTHKWKFAWTRDGRIFVRREQGQTAFRVRSEQDLKKMFRTES